MGSAVSLARCGCRRPPACPDPDSESPSNEQSEGRGVVSAPNVTGRSSGQGVTSRLRFGGSASASGRCFCHHCQSFFSLQAGQRRSDELRCAGCQSTFIEMPRPSAWIRPSSSVGRRFSFEDSLDQAIRASLETAVPDKPTNSSFVRGLPRRAVEQGDLDNCQQCTFCCEDFALGHEETFLPCQHFFHGKCLEQWLQKRNSCPVCRHALPEEEDDVPFAPATSADNVVAHNPRTEAPAIAAN
mmetsp:Transcript_39267/g.94439  ORF Transcript_39267/g.94439 Transcript_39267/m.94439 type:complete len:242 (-) Transcript_39267:289-1014(-)